MQQGADIWDAAGYLGMSPEVLERVYGHHHPDFQSDVAERMSGQNRDRNPVNKHGTSAMNVTKIANIFKGHKVKRAFGTQGSQVRILPLRPDIH